MSPVCVPAVDLAFRGQRKHEIPQIKDSRPLRILSEYEYLWDGSDPGWVLVAENDAESGVEFLIYNKNRKTMLVIEDASVSKAVSERMLSFGVELIPEVPKTEFRLEDIEIEE